MASETRTHAPADPTARCGWAARPSSRPSMPPRALAQVTAQPTTEWHQPKSATAHVLQGCSIDTLSTWPKSGMYGMHALDERPSSPSLTFSESRWRLVPPGSSHMRHHSDGSGSTNSSSTNSTCQDSKVFVKSSQPPLEVYRYVLPVLPDTRSTVHAKIPVYLCCSYVFCLPIRLSATDLYLRIPTHLPWCSPHTPGY